MFNIQYNKSIHNHFLSHLFAHINLLLCWDNVTLKNEFCLKMDTDIGYLYSEFSADLKYKLQTELLMIIKTSTVMLYEGRPGNSEVLNITLRMR